MKFCFKVTNMHTNGIAVFDTFGYMALIDHYLPGKFLREEEKINGRKLFVPVSREQ